MHPDNHLLASSFTTKLNLCYHIPDWSCFSPWLSADTLLHLQLSTCIWPGTWPKRALSIYAEHPFALEVVVIGNQLTILKIPPFYKSTCSKPNRSASPFREARLDYQTLLRSNSSQLSLLQKRSATLRRVQRSWCSWGLPQIMDLIPSNAWNLVPITTSVRYIGEDLWTMTKFCINLFL